MSARRFARKDRQVVGTRQEAAQGAVRRRGPMIESLPRSLSALDPEQLRDARDRRDARMSVLFRRWTSLSTMEMTELRTLSDERQRLAKHAGIRRGLQRLRATSKPAVPEAT
jgi:hypothetical protein